MGQPVRNVCHCRPKTQKGNSFQECTEQSGIQPEDGHAFDKGLDLWDYTVSNVGEWAR
jgi:hypothetical protein